MSAAPDFANHILDLLDTFGRFEARRMLGGFAIFHPGLMFVPIADGNLYLQADAQSPERFLAEGSSALCYDRKDKEYPRSCLLALETFFAGEAECRQRARLAFDATSGNPDKRKQEKS